MTPTVQKKQLWIHPMSSKKQLISEKKKKNLLSLDKKMQKHGSIPPPTPQPPKKICGFFHRLPSPSKQTQGTVNSTCGWSELGSTLALLQQSTCLSDQFRPQILGGMKGGLGHEGPQKFGQNVWVLKKMEPKWRYSCSYITHIPKTSIAVDFCWMVLSLHLHTATYNPLPWILALAGNRKPREFAVGQIFQRPNSFD